MVHCSLQLMLSVRRHVHTHCCCVYSVNASSEVAAGLSRRCRINRNCYSKGLSSYTTLVGFNTLHKINCVDFLESVAGRDSGVGQQT